jgi:hypothetical protein
MLAHNGAAIHQISYSIFKKLGREDDELVKTNLTPNGVGGNPMEARDVVSMELTVGTKLLATTLFVIEVQGNYSVILGRGWIHINRSVSSTLHQFLIQWINGEIELVHANASAYIVQANATTDWQHGSAQCLSRKDLSGYDFLSVTKVRFVPVSVHSASEAQLCDVVFQ